MGEYHEEGIFRDRREAECLRSFERAFKDITDSYYA